MKKMMVLAALTLSFVSAVGHADESDDIVNSCQQLKIHILRANAKLQNLKADAEENGLSRSLKIKIDRAELDYNVSKVQYRLACK